MSELDNLHDPLRLDRTLLKDMAVERLRDHIGGGLIPEGTKITEREVSQLLGISRMPARDALMALEHEGLVQSRPDGRYVIQLTENDVRDILQVRAALERLAAELAALNITDEGRALLEARLRDLEDAVAVGDPDLCTKRDIELHRAIWQQAKNPHLLRFLESMVGVVFVLAQRVNYFGNGDPQRLLDEHREVVELIVTGNAPEAGRALEAELRHALLDALRTFRISQRVERRER